MAGRPPVRSATLGPFTGTLKFSGIVIKSDPKSSYRPSRTIELIVDGEPRTVAFQLRETQSTLTWEVKPAVFITAKSTISIQPYEARTLIRRKKAETVAIQGDAVFRFCSSRSGDKHEFERACVGFRVILSVVVQKDTKLKDKSRSDYGGHAGSPGENGRDFFFGPPTAPNSFKRALKSLRELMELPVISPDSGIYEAAREASDALRTACNSMPTDTVEEDVQNLGDQVHDLLVDMQLPKFSERLTSQTHTITYLLNLVGNAALFAEDCSKLEIKELHTVDYRKPILGDFDRQLTTLKRNFIAGKETYEWRQPYTRPPVPTPPGPLLVIEEETRSEISAVEPEPDTCTIILDEDQRLMDLLGPDFTPSELLNLSCLEWTRKELLSKITAWFDDFGEPNVLWLSGAPGTGKTAIAWSLIAELERQQRCAGYLFIRQNYCAPYQIWRTIAYRMAKFHPAIKNEVYKAVTREEGVLLDDVQWMFENLVAAPLKALDARLLSRGPIVLIDGFEQCGQTYPGWQAAVDTLPQWLSLPHHCKLIITSRPQSEIEKAFEGRDIKRMELYTGNEADSSTEDDVRTYLNHRFTEMKRQDKSISEYWPDGDAISELVNSTKGFFRWAAIAVDTIEYSGNKENELKTVVEGGTTTTFYYFDQYLQEILDMASGYIQFVTFRATMGTIALSMRPLSMRDLEYFLQTRFPTSSGGSLEATCYKLLPIILIEDEDKTIKIRHKAYKDYLTDPKRCTRSEFLIDQSKTHRKMTISCLKIMQQKLKFNISGFKSSYRMNSEVEDKEKCIPSLLGYACQYWADHLRGIATTEKRDAEIVSLLRHFLNSNLLHWLEVLSLLSNSNIASKSLVVAAGWLEATDKDLSLMAVDASRFSLTFADVISASVPHIYLSALPFAPPSSLISKRYRDQFPWTIKVLHEEGVKWPAMRFSISTSNYVCCVSIHPDSKKVAAGMSDGVAMVVSVSMGSMGETLFYLPGHMATVRAIAYSPSGKRIATGCDDRRLRIYDAENGLLLFDPFEIHSDWIRSVAWSPDGQRIVTGSDDRKVKVVIAETGQVIYDMAFHNDWVFTVLFTTEFFISCSDDRTVRIYDASTGAASGEVWSTEQTGYTRAIAISPDGKILAAGSSDSSIILYNMDTRTVNNHPIRGHSGSIRSLAFSKDGQTLASCGEDQTVRLWNVHTGRKICDPLYGNTSTVSSVKFSPDMKQLVTGGEDSSIRFFDMDSLPIQKNYTAGTGLFRAAAPLKDGNTILASDGLSISRWSVDKGHVESVPLEGNSEAESKHLADIQSVSISPNGRLVATASNQTVMIWHAESGKILWGPLEGHSDDIYALSFSADGKMVVSGSDDRSVWIWSAETGQSICGPLEGHSAVVKGVCFSPDGKQVASGSHDSTAIMWSVESGEKVHDPLIHHRDWVYGVAYSPNGHYLATGSDDYSVAIWDVATGERVLQTLTGHGGYVRIVNWSSDSKMIISGALDKAIRIFDVETGIPLCEPLMGHKDYLRALSFRSSLHGGEPEVVSASLDGTVRVWEIRKGFVKAQTFSGFHGDWIHAIAFSPTEDLIASGGDDGRLVVMDVVSGYSKLYISAHTDWIRCVTYSRDGKKIATCSDDSTIIIWDANSGERFLEPLEGHIGPVLSIEFSPGGNFLVSGGEDNTVRTWDLHPTFIKLNNPLSSYRGHTGAVNAVAYARGGELIVSGSASAEIAIWEGRASDKRILQFVDHGGPILSICISDSDSDERIFSSSEDKTIRIWDLSTGRALLSILHGHTAPVNAIALTPDGNTIVSAADDGSMRIFDAHSGELCALPLYMSGRMFAVAVSRDGALVACSGEDMRVHVWRANMTSSAAAQQRQRQQQHGASTGAVVSWPDNFMRRARGLEFCLVDEQGVLTDFTLPDDGWLRGSTNDAMCWIPSVYRAGLWTPRTVGILGALETILDLRSFVHGTKWEQCRAVADKS